MHSRLLVPLLCAAALVFACGPRPHSDATATATAATTTAPVPKKKAHGPSGPLLATSLDVSVKEGVNLAFHITNSSGKALELTFPTGQTHDFAVLDSAGREVWRWSAGRLFTQALRNRVLDAGETATYDVRWDTGARRGTFTAVATLKSDSHPVESRVEFSVP
jgi:hypothetical protein